MSLSYTELWDSDCTQPALPSGWNTSSAVLATENTYAYSGTQALSLSSPTGSTPYLATWGTGDGSGSSPFSLTLTGVCAFRTGASVNGNMVGIAFRGSASTLNGTSTSCYLAYLQANYIAGTSYLYFGKLISGTLTNIGTVSISSGLGSGTWYTINLAMTGDGATSNVTEIGVQRMADSYWLNSSGTFVSGGVTAINSNDASILTGQYYGIFLESSSNLTPTVDNWSVNSNPTSLILMPRPLIVQLPKGFWSQE